MPWRLDIINRNTKSRRLTEVIELPFYSHRLFTLDESAILTRLPNNVVPMAGRCYTCREAITTNVKGH